MSSASNRFLLLGQKQNRCTHTQYMDHPVVMTETVTQHSRSLHNYMYVCVFMYISLVWVWVWVCVIVLLPCHFLYMSIPTCSVKDKEKPSSMWSPQTVSSAIGLSPCVIAGFAITSPSPCSHYLITTQAVWWENWVLSQGPFKITFHISFIIYYVSLYSGFPHLFISFLIQFPIPPLPLYPPYLPLTAPMLLLPLSTFLGEWVESSMGMWDPRRAGGLPLTTAHFVCKPGASYQFIQSLSLHGCNYTEAPAPTQCQQWWWLLVGLVWSTMCPR